jgi:hypothetical protein
MADEYSMAFVITAARVEFMKRQLPSPGSRDVLISVNACSSHFIEGQNNRAKELIKLYRQ